MIPENITFEASFYADSKRTNSIAVLCIKGEGVGCWNTKHWFPRNYCEFSEVLPYGNITVTAPKWLLEAKGLLNKVTQIKK